MKLTWISPDDAATTIVFSRDAANYRLLKVYDGLTAIPVTHYAKKAPYQHGMTFIASAIEPREVSFDVMILSSDLDELQGLVKALADAFNPILGEGTLIYEVEDGTTYSLTCIGNNTPSISPSERAPFYQRVTIDLIAHNPFWYSSGTHIEYLRPTAAAFFPFSFPFSLGSNTDTVTVTNEGTTEAELTITFNGEMVDPVLTNSTTGKQISVSLSMSATERLVITTGFGDKTATYYKSDGSTENAFKYLSSDSELFGLEPGENTLVLTDVSIAAASFVSIEWQDKYVGV